MPRTRELIQEIVGLLEGDDELQLEFARAFLTSRTLRRLFQADPELQETLRRLILTDALLQLPEKVEPLLQLPEKIEPLLQLPERVEALEAAVSELRAIVNRIEPVVNRIEPIVNRIEPAVMELQRWQWGSARGAHFRNGSRRLAPRRCVGAPTDSHVAGRCRAAG
jgi:hypothetical protein